MSLPAPLTHEENEAALERFCEFLRFETVSSIAPQTGAYQQCAQWLVQQLESLECLDEVFLLDEAPEQSPVVVAVWKGVDDDDDDGALPVLLLNSHYDVVPAAAVDWTVPAFQGLRRDGLIYGRGTQDMKCVCLQYLEALRAIRARRGPSWRPARSVYLTFVPDEEIGGAGMAAFLDSALYRSLPGIALALDEGLASTTDAYAVFYGERLPWWVDVTATGPTGHGSRFIDNTAVEQLVELSNKALAFRQGQRAQLGLNDHENCAHAVARKNKTLGDVTSLNITTLQAGVQVGGTFAYNCVPPTAKCSLDIRISPHVEPSEIGAMLDTWCQECSKDDVNKVEWSFLGGQGNSMQGHATTSTDPQQNPWYAVFAGALSDMGLSIEPQVFPAATDSRFLRALGIRALGFSPMKNTEIMLHENDEYIPESEYLQGILVYIGLIEKLASQGKEIEKTIPTTNGSSSK